MQTQSLSDYVCLYVRLSIRLSLYHVAHVEWANSKPKRHNCAFSCGKKSIALQPQKREIPTMENAQHSCRSRARYCNISGYAKKKKRICWIGIRIFLPPLVILLL